MTVYKSCPWIEHGIVFDHCNIVRQCAHFNPIHGGRPIIYNNYHGEKFNWRKFWDAKKKLREDAKKGIYLPECKDCMCLGERDWEKENYIDRILLTPWIACNSRCVYCNAPVETEVLENTTSYKILPVMKDFIKRKIFSADANIDFAGGEPTIYPEFEDLIDLFIKNNINDIVVHTNAIKYSEKIEEAIKKGIMRILISVDSATPEMHKTIKQVDTYEKVWKSIEKYSKAQEEGARSVRLKYIIVPGINDNKEELTKWLLKSKSLGINYVALNVDFNWLMANVNNLSRHIYDLTMYVLDKAEELQMEVELYPQITETKNRLEREFAKESINSN